MPATGVYSTVLEKNPPTEATQVSTIVKVVTAALSVPVNIFTGTLQGILGFTITKVRVLVDGRYCSYPKLLNNKYKPRPQHRPKNQPYAKG